MRGWLLTLLVVVPVLAGCASPPPPGRAVTPAPVAYDPRTMRVASVGRDFFNLTSWDGATTLAGVAYVPHSKDATPRGAPTWPLVVFLHGWGGSKEDYMGQVAPVPGAAQATTRSPDRLAAFAQAGIVALAFDARGFGQSSGQATVAGPAEQRDLDHVIEWATNRYPINGHVGLVGASYGGGQALLALTRNPAVATVASMYGWTDLAGALIPGNVPKLEWGQFLYGYGLPGSHGRYDPMVHNWYKEAILRQQLDLVKVQMAARSSLAQLPGNGKPIFQCQGMQESLFPQADIVAQASAGFTRTYVFTGGHGADNGPCWDKSLAWMQFFLGGFDTRVDDMPALETVDASGVGSASYADWPAASVTVLHPRGPDLSPGPPSADTFTIEQRLASNPLAEPSALWDASGMPTQALPEGLREDPTALFFAGAPIEGDPVLLGAPALRLHVHGEPAFPFQVAASLYRVTPDGNARLLGRAAAAPLSAADMTDGLVPLAFPWVRAQLGPGDVLQLKLASNDPSEWYPLLADYSVTFDGASELRLPLHDE